MGGDAARLIQSVLLPHFDLLAARHQDCELAAWCAFYPSDYQACLHCLQRCEQTHSDPPAIPRYFNDLHSACLCYLQPAAAANSLSRCWDLFAGAQRLALITAICRPPFLQRVAVDASFLCLRRRGAVSPSLFTLTRPLRQRTARVRSGAVACRPVGSCSHSLDAGRLHCV